MYDIMRLVKRIYYKYPTRFWLSILFIIALLFMIRPIGKTVVDIINPPAPTATPRPTPGVNQDVSIGEPALILDTYYTVLGYQEFDSKCKKFSESTLGETTKIVAVEFWSRHYGLDPVTLSNFYLRDSVGTNYQMRAATSLETRENICMEPLSLNLNETSDSFKLQTGYGNHQYFYSAAVPASADDLEFTFQISYSIPYTVTGESTDGSSKAYVKLQNPGYFAEPADYLLGPPSRMNLSTDRTIRIDDIAFAIYDIHRVAGDNAKNDYYLEILFQNVSDNMLKVNFNNDFAFSVIDNYGVPISATLSSMNTGYNSSLAPQETQKYYISWSMEQKSVKQKYMYLRIDRKTADLYYFIQIPFKDSLIVQPTPTPVIEEYLYRTPVPGSNNSQTIVRKPTATPVQCVNTLPPRLKPGDTAAVTYTPPVANRLRKDPGYKGSIITTISPGRTFYVMDGPVCADNLYWYYVNFNGRYGWTAESDEGQYWLEKKNNPYSGY
ncbi:MAG: hypothetical protein IJI14_11500 [Anaerolineaceae bacterium]|nr:hypothetical protein [Anaerolineaceae bacterium]